MDKTVLLIVLKTSNIMGIKLRLYNRFKKFLGLQ